MQESFKVFNTVFLFNAGISELLEAFLFDIIIRIRRLSLHKFLLETIFISVDNYKADLKGSEKTAYF